MKWFLACLSVALFVVIGCGGDSPVDEASLTTGNTSNTTGNTTGNTGGNSVIPGVYRGGMSGSNTKGARYSGSGYANIGSSGTAYFSFSATVQGIPYNRDFTGTISSTGAFTGVTQTGEATRGSVSVNGSILSASLVWEKRTSSGALFYTETENFTLTRS